MRGVFCKESLCFQLAPSSCARQVSCDGITVLTSTKKKVLRVLARKSLPRTNQNSHSAFSHQIRNNSKKDKTKTSQMMGWIENRPNKFLNQNFLINAQRKQLLEFLLNTKETSELNKLSENFVRFSIINN